MKVYYGVYGYPVSYILQMCHLANSGAKEHLNEGRQIFSPYISKVHFSLKERTVGDLWGLHKGEGGDYLPKIIFTKGRMVKFQFYLASVALLVDISRLGKYTQICLKLILGGFSELIYS